MKQKEDLDNKVVSSIVSNRVKVSSIYKSNCDITVLLQFIFTDTPGSPVDCNIVDRSTGGAY